MMKRNPMRWNLLSGQKDSGFSNSQELGEKNPHDIISIYTD